MVRADYRKLLNKQKSWTRKLTKKVNLDNGTAAGGDALLALIAINFLLTLSLQPPERKGCGLIVARQTSSKV